MDEEKKGFLRIALIIFTIIYIASPVDLLPGLPVDDIVVLLLQFFIQNRLSQKKETHAVANPVAETYNTFTEDIVEGHEV